MINWEKEFSEILNSSFGYEFINIDEKKQIVLYGAGSLGSMAIDLLREKEIIPTAVIDKNLEGELKGISVKKMKDLSSKELLNSLFIICISSIEFTPIYNELKEKGCKNIIHFYDYSECFFKEILGNGWSKSNIDEQDIKNIKKVLKTLEHDENSLAHYLQFLYWKIKRIEKIYDNYPVLSSKKYFGVKSFPNLSQEEKYLDGGAHFGNTILDFMKISNNKYSKIWAFEPDVYNMKKLKENVNNSFKIEFIPNPISDNDKKVLFYENLGFASKIDNLGELNIDCKTIDSFNFDPTIMKLHLEGEELKALNGASYTIKKYRPILMVLADHNADGLYKIANYLISLDNYKIYFYLHDYCGNSAVFYAYPIERDKL